jgi:hypothetical protein
VFGKTFWRIILIAVVLTIWTQVSNANSDAAAKRESEELRAAATPDSAVAECVSIWESTGQPTGQTVRKLGDMYYRVELRIPTRNALKPGSPATEQTYTCRLEYGTNGWRLVH